MKILCAEQRTPEWTKARLGRLTSTGANAMLANGRGGAESTQRRNLRLQLVLERITGRSQEKDFKSQAMQDGADREFEAQAIYEGISGRLLNTTGFVAHDSLMAGCSPDGYLGDFQGIVEIKCPIPATHLEYLRTGTVPTDYLRQIQHQLWITDAAWCDWLSYQPEFPEPLRVKMVRVDRDETQMKAYELLVRQFLAEVDKEYAEVDQMAGVAF
jgi:YqaJ-like viral recombinase domain